MCLAGIVRKAERVRAGRVSLVSDAAVIWFWAVSALALVSLVWSLIVLLRDREMPPIRGAVWTVLIFLIPVFVPVGFLVWTYAVRAQDRRRANDRASVRCRPAADPQHRRHRPVL